MSNKKIALAVVAALVLAAAGVVASTAVANPQSFRTSSGTGTVTLHKTSLGKVLATGTGMSLYLFKADKRGKSACYGQCATYWPPLLKKGKVTAGAGLKAKLLGTTKRKNGTLQVTYAGHPLYRFKLDKKVGQVAGQGQDFFGGKWYVLSSAGTAITKAASTTTNTTTTAPTTTYCPYGGC